MTFSVPSALAAATRALIPPPPAAEVCFDQSVPPLGVFDLEQPAKTRPNTATTASTANRGVRLIVASPLRLPPPQAARSVPQRPAWGESARTWLRRRRNGNRT